MKVTKTQLIKIMSETEGEEVDLSELLYNNSGDFNVLKECDAFSTSNKQFRKLENRYRDKKRFKNDREKDKIRSNELLEKLKDCSISELELSELNEYRYLLNNRTKLELDNKKNSIEGEFFNAKYYSLFENSFIEKELAIPDRSYSDKWKHSTNPISEEKLRNTIKNIIGVFNGEVCENYYSSNYIDIPILRNTECQFVIKNILGSQSMSSFDVYPELLYSMYQLGISIEYIFMLMVRDHDIKDYYLDLTVDELAGLFNIRFSDTLYNAYRISDDEIHSFIEYLDYCRYNLINSKSNLTLRELIKDKKMFNY